MYLNILFSIIFTLLLSWKESEKISIFWNIYFTTKTDVNKKCMWKVSKCNDDLTAFFLLNFRIIAFSHKRYKYSHVFWLAHILYIYGFYKNLYLYFSQISKRLYWIHPTEFMTAPFHRDDLVFAVQISSKKRFNFNIEQICKKSTKNC